MEKKIEKLINDKTLKWLPWIGSEYFKNEHRILFVGESHYSDASVESNFKHDDIHFTRNVIKDMGIKDNNYNVLFFKNLKKLILNDKALDSEIMWSKISFYNFIQRPMFTNKERPKSVDYKNGWMSFFELVKVMKPTKVIFLSLSAADKLEISLKKVEDVKLINQSWEYKIGRSYSKKSKIQIGENQVEIVYLLHPSRLRNQNDFLNWNLFLKKEAEDELNFLVK